MNPQEIVAEVFEQLRGMWRFRWLAVGVAWATAIAGGVYVFSMPDVFRASARVFVDTNSLLRPLMEGLTAQQDPLDEVQLVSTAVLSRPNLEEVAHETDLALRARTPAQMESLITGLQERIRIRGGRDNIFTIDYEDMSREKSVAVVAAVLDTFVENAIGNQGDDADVTESALASEIRTHEDRLNAAETVLAAFKRENVGFMPGEAGDYYQRLQTTLAAANQLREQVQLLSQRRQEVARQIEGEVPVFGSVMAGPVEQATGVSCAQSAQISQLEAQLETLRVDFTDKHPRILAIQETLSALQQRCAEEQALAGDSGSFTAFPSVDPLEVNPVYQSLRIELSTTELELASARAALQARQAEVESLQRDVDKIVQVETELKQLNRDYDVVQGRHQELLRRWEDLQAKKRLDPVTDRVQFRRIDPPFALAEPVGPNRPLFFGAVLMAALGGSFGLAFALNRMRPTFFTARSLQRAVDLPVLGSISVISVTRDSLWWRAEPLVWAAAYLALFAAIGLATVLSRPGALERFGL
jgi:polysaccharide chain length determinant protein (PEP-CTERM system associated)